MIRSPALTHSFFSSPNQDPSIRIGEKIMGIRHQQVHYVSRNPKTPYLNGITHARLTGEALGSPDGRGIDLGRRHSSSAGDRVRGGLGVGESAEDQRSNMELNDGDF